MDLLSLDGVERYHTLAALMDIGGEEHDHFDFMGIVPEDRPARISRIMHEITHVGSLRTTRLGFWIARVASQTLNGRKQIPEVLDVAAEIEIVLGVFAPLLEGLALYGQLDYDCNNAEEILPFPLNKIAANNTGDGILSGGVLRALRMARIAAVWEGTLGTLFLDVTPQTEHYFAGYLYVKAMVAKLKRFDSSLAEPTTALPLLVRLICDHPILERACVEPLSARTIINCVLRSLHDFSESGVQLIARMLSQKDVREAFDNWDIHEQLAKQDGHPLVIHSSMNSIFSGMLEDQFFTRLRGATSVHLTSWTAGIMTKLDFVNGEARLELVDGQDRKTASIIFYSAMNSTAAQLNEKSKAALEQFEDLFYSKLAAAYHAKLPVAVGNYLTLTRGQVGMVLWVDNELTGIIPLSLLDNRLDKNEISVAMEGLRLSPVFRRQFAHALRATDTQALARGEANDAIMFALVGDLCGGQFCFDVDSEPPCHRAFNLH